MNVWTIKTEKVLPGAQSLYEFIDGNIDSLEEKSVVVITSKVISLCENRAAAITDGDKSELIISESDLYMSSDASVYPDFQFTITGHTLIPNSGIDESNTNGNFLLWPEYPQQTANEIRAYLRNKFGIENLGIIISDSTCMPLRWGAVGIAIAYSGFAPTNDYVGSKDLFGQEFKVTKSNIAGGLAAAATVVMGEGAEQTPLAIIDNVSFVQFQDHNPNQEELENFYITDMNDDLFSPFFNSVTWYSGKRKELK